jgi:hypothetical protein
MQAEYSAFLRKSVLLADAWRISDSQRADVKFSGRAYKSTIGRCVFINTKNKIDKTGFIVHFLFEPIRESPDSQT